MDGRDEGERIMGKVSMAVALGAGYVLGTRAGRGRYEQLRDRAQKVWTNPKVQQQATKVKEQAKQVPGQAKEHLPESIGRMTGSDQDRGTNETMPAGVGSASSASSSDLSSSQTDLRDGQFGG